MLPLWVHPKWYIGCMANLIGITAGEIYNKDDSWSPITYGQSRTYSDALIAANGIPIILPLTNKKSILRATYESLSGLLLAGGNDVDPKLYGEEPHKTTMNVSAYRDAYEKQLIMWALQDRKPIVAICRGMQILNVVCGGSICQDISSYFPQAEDHNSSTATKDIEHLAHSLRIEPTSKLASILGVSTIKTNTHHHQAINLLASNLQAVAWTEDGIIEALESKDDAYIIAVQSHPESLTAKAEPTWHNMFLSFVKAADVWVLPSD